MLLIRKFLDGLAPSRTSLLAIPNAGMFFFWRLDYAGISLMIVCSFFAPIYYAFSYNPYSRFLYLTSISLLGILLIITLLAPALSTPCFRSFKASFFLTMGFSGVIPTAQAVVLFWGHPQMLLALGYELVIGVLYAVGVSFYMSRIPERWKFGAFDIAGHSHQIFHVFVVAGALAHSAATLLAMNWRRGLANCERALGLHATVQTQCHEIHRHASCCLWLHCSVPLKIVPTSVTLLNHLVYTVGGHRPRDDAIDQDRKPQMNRTYNIVPAKERNLTGTILLETCIAMQVRSA
ncbi:hypothetical protein HYC85_001216 [Camellia sinensis]|uniref:Uncharacterized protein n=1 Tax=Camellia sinensis TaxID=4442 RepID=A0A7J7I601_CAMSI|nr:hypothetical protein HYC85_001216 [Camellia sinensis]